MKKKKILIGTHNQGKFKEIAYLLRNKVLKISPQKLNLKSPKETGKTFKSNSKLKAEYFSKHVSFPVISDDSGLCIEALKGKPGIYSARMAKQCGGFNKAMIKILKLMQNKRNRAAKFVCSLSYKIKGKKTKTVVGIIQGTISEKILGNKGFGYDSIFIPINEKMTFGQMSKFKKINMDHRFIAFKKLKKNI